MAHAHEPPVLIDGFAHPRAFEGIPRIAKHGQLDEECPTCAGHGQRNTEIHAHFRSKRQPCDDCLGEGWIETSGDATPVPDIIIGPSGEPQWIIRWVPFDNAALARNGRCLINERASLPPSED